MSRIVSSIPGRLRIRDPQLRTTIGQNALTAQIQQLPALQHCLTNTRTGSVLLYYDTTIMTQATVEQAIGAMLDQVLGQPPATSRATLPALKHLNRYNKLAMLASLSSSLALLKIRRKRWRYWHAITGYAFVANLAVHLFIYRKSLLRLFR